MVIFPYSRVRILLLLCFVLVLYYHFFRTGHVSAHLHELVSGASSWYIFSFDVLEHISADRNFYIQ